MRGSPGHLRAKFPAFVRPMYHFDMYQPELLGYSAIDRNRVLWRVDAQGGGGGRVSFANDTASVLNYRFFLGIFFMALCTILACWLSAAFSHGSFTDSSSSPCSLR